MNQVYKYSLNNPVGYNDPSGAEPPPTINHSAFYNQYYIGYTYDDRVDYTGLGDPVCGHCWRTEMPGVMGFYMAATGYGGALFGMGPGWKPGQGSMFAAFNAWVDNQVAKAHQRQNIKRGITEALTSKDQGIFNVDPRTGKVTQLFSQDKFRKDFDTYINMIAGTTSFVRGYEGAAGPGHPLWSLFLGKLRNTLETLGFREREGTKIGFNSNGYGVVIIGNGNTEHALKKVGYKHIGEVDLNNPEDLFNILNKLTAANELEAISSFYQTFYTNPLNQNWRGELKLYYRDPSHPGYYWSPATSGDIGYKIQISSDGSWSVRSFSWQLGPPN
ncbi:MAG: hypothetical protein HRU69_11335 [Flammeovirgaceae bacterium]|nr:MAG: hypothetical protein HRU69_11335 [Flammeovirgaceae bacterium]